MRSTTFLRHVISSVVLNTNKFLNKRKILPRNEIVVFLEGMLIISSWSVQS